MNIQYTTWYHKMFNKCIEFKCSEYIGVHPEKNVQKIVILNVQNILECILGNAKMFTAFERPNPASGSCISDIGI